MNFQEMSTIVNALDYKPGWHFKLHEKGDGYLIQCIFKAPNNVTGKLEDQHCRKWFISKHATENEVVTTAFKAVLAGEEHEAKEFFTYKKARIFDPHVDMTYLAEVMNNAPQDTRT